MTIRVLAPGKMVLVGEYAVLYGAPALVAAVDREAAVSLSTQAGAGLVVHAPDIGIVNLRLYWESGHLGLQNGRPLPPVLKVVSGVLGFYSSRLQARVAHEELRIEIDTSGFVQQADNCKLGLGSSAAVTVALTRALLTYLEASKSETNHDSLFTTTYELHREMQGGVGSGLDVAASVYGSLVAYPAREQGSVPRPKKVAAPGWPPMQVVFVGHAASTPELVAKVNAWKQASPDRFQALMSTMGAICAAVLNAARDHDPMAVRQGCAAYGECMAKLGVHSGADILSAAHRAMLQLAGGSVSYKPSGAGGGDLGLFFGDSAADFLPLLPSIEAAGATPLSLGIAPEGVRLLLS